MQPSIEDIPGIKARALFVPDGAAVFREDNDLSPVLIDPHTAYMPWGADNQMPFDILSLVEDDETLSTCQQFNAEVCYGSGLVYDTSACSTAVQQEVADFFLDNAMPDYFLGCCQDFKHFGFCLTVLVLNADASRVVQILRKEACYVRFAPADAAGRIPYVLYANWRRSISSAREVERIPLLDTRSPWRDLRLRLGRMADARGRRATPCRDRKFAILTRVPTPDSTYYPIPYYAALFKGKWYSIKRLIAVAKEAKLRNSAPIKYQIEIAAKYWESIFRAEGITDRRRQQERIVQEKQRILDFLTGVENSGKAWFSTFYVSPTGQEQHDVVIRPIETKAEGGDWSTDIIEAVNMVCFTMRVHSNLVGSVPGKSQTNNSGSDKRELYTIAQALQKPYHDLLFLPHRIIIRCNGWHGAEPRCPFIQLTTLDEHTDAREVQVAENAQEA